MRVKDALFIVSFKLTHLVLFKVWNEVSLVLFQNNFRKKVADTQKLKEFEKVGFFGKLFLSNLMTIKPLLPRFITRLPLETAAKIYN